MSPNGILLRPRRGWALVHTGYVCNNRCVFCAQGGLRANTPPLLTEEVLGALAGATRVAFMGGEPTLRQELPDWIRLARRAGARRVVLQTNARRLAYRAYARSLARAGAHALDVSLQGPRAELHDHHTRVPGSFKQTVAGITSARAAGLEVGVSAVITRSNFRHLTQLVRRVAGLGVTRLRLAPARACGEAGRLLPRVVPRLALVRPHLAEAARAAATLGIGLEVAGVPPCVFSPVDLFSDGPSWDGEAADHPGLEQAAQEPVGALPMTCQACALAGQCDGVDPGYLVRFGGHELSPMTAADRRVDLVAGVGTGPAELFLGLGRVEVRGG